MIPRYRAVGRTAPNGKVYSAVTTQKEDDLVPVRSILTKWKGDLNVVTPDLLDPKLNDYTDGAAIGLSLGTGFMEASTQGVLGLKHGGHERVLDLGTYLKAPKECTFREDDIWIYLKPKTGKELQYPKPRNLVVLGKTEFSEGEPVCCAYNTCSPINKLNRITELIHAHPNAKKKYYEKDNVIVSECYAYEDGEIHYIQDPKTKRMRVSIGNHFYAYNPDCMYYFPEGAKVKKFQKFASGLVNLAMAKSVLKDNLDDLYQIFRKQYYDIFSGSYGKTGIVEDSDMPEEVLELVFAGLTSISFNPKTAAVEDIQVNSVEKAILSKNSFFTTLSFGKSASTVQKALKGEVDMSGDIMTETVLGLLLNDKLDKI